MLPFENMVADYIKETNNHVMYRVTPVYKGNNLLATGVKMEAKSVEDDGDGICFNIYVYNVQPGVEIDYATGNSWLSEQVEEQESSSEVQQNYVLNTNTKKIHKPSCSSAKQTKVENREEYYGTISELLNRGYDACQLCKP